MDVLEFQEGELEQRLDDLVETAAQVFDVAGAGIMLIDEHGHLRLIGASDETGRALELAQQETGTGPGIQSTRRNSVVAVDDLAQDERWPLIREDLVPKGVLSVLSAPISLLEHPAGNLNLFDRSPREWTQADRSGLVAFAGVVAAMLRIALEAQHTGQLVRELSAKLAPEGTDDH
jgi:GAF domain-containing protein